MPDDVTLVPDAELVECVAQKIFESRGFCPDDPAKPAWCPRGNSVRQEDARDLARAAIAAMQPVLDAARHEAEAVCTAWQHVFEGIEAHLLDRIAMGDQGNPQAYLDIIRGDAAGVLAASKQIVASRWHDAACAREALDAAREAGRRDGWKAGQAHMQERAAETCDRLSYTPHPGAATRAAMCARQIRAFALIPPAPPQDEIIAAHREGRDG